MAPSQPRRLFFVHLMKTAGTVVNLALRRTVGRSAMYPGPAFDGGAGATVDVNGLLEAWPTVRDDVRLVAGHFPAWVVDALDDDFATFTILRHPVDRTLSMLRRQRERLDASDPATLTDIYEETFLPSPATANHMVRMLGTGRADLPAGLLTPMTPTPDHLARAIDRVAAIDVVGVQEDLAGFCGRMRDTLGVDLGALGVGNVSESADVPNGLAERIAADSALDLALYEHVVDMLGPVSGPTGSDL